MDEDGILNIYIPLQHNNNKVILHREFSLKQSQNSK